MTFLKNNLFTLTLAIGCITSGILFYALYNQWIVVIVPHNTTSPEALSALRTSKQKIELFFKTPQSWKHEKTEILWSHSPQENLGLTIKKWLSYVHEEHYSSKKITLQSALLPEQGSIAYLSFDRSPFHKQQSVTCKMYWLESLLKTIRHTFPSIESVKLLVHHQPLKDYHIATLQPLPVSGYYEQTQTVQSSTLPKKNITIMLDPAGDAQNPGRVIGDSFERGLTLQCAQQIKKELEHLLPNARVVLTRFPGETLEPLQNAAFSNRLQADIFISLHFYQETEERSHVGIYYFVHRPDTDYWKIPTTPFEVIPYDQAHKKNVTLSAGYATTLYTVLCSLQKQGFMLVTQPRGIPFKPLLGVLAPAIGFDIGLTNKDQWQQFAPTLATAIASLCQT